MNNKIYKNNWRKLDNTAKIFSLDDRSNTNIFRLSLLLKEKVNVKLLKKALKKTLKDCPTFNLKIGTGFFWNYLELNNKEPIIKKENEIPCDHIDFKQNNDYLFKVTYYNNKINLDIFHILTDGTGATILLKILIYNYLNLKNNIISNINIKNDNKNYQDLYLKYYDKNYKMSYDFKPAYQLPGIPNKKINKTYHYIIRVNEMKNICKKLNATITEYLTAIYIYALYLSLYNKKSNKEINVTVPINLRNFFNNETDTNFFTYMNITSNINNKDNISFNEILKHVKQEFKEKLNDNKIKEYLARDVKLGMNLSIRLVPLFIKKLFIKFMGVLVTKSSTTTLSNVGIIKIEDKYKKYIDNILVLVRPNRIQKIKCTICSYEDKLNITVNSNIDDKKFQKSFLKLLQNNLKQIQIESNIK